MEAQSLESKMQTKEIRAAMKEVKEELILKTLEAKVENINAQGKKLEARIRQELRTHKPEGDTALDSSGSMDKDIVAGSLGTSNDMKGEKDLKHDKEKDHKQEKETRAQRLQELLNAEKKQTEEVAT
eukprot:13534457-Heterocapsa_arctica.AAC.1